MNKSGSHKDLSFDFNFLDKLVVGIGEVAQITNIATRQIRYWEDKGIITSLTEEEGKNRRYDYKNIKKMLLIFSNAIAMKRISRILWIIGLGEIGLPISCYHQMQILII